MATGKQLQRLIEKTDTALAGAEDAVIDRVNVALEASYKSLERELLRSYGKYQGNQSLLPNQRKLLILSETSQLLSLINTRNADAIASDFEGLIRGGYESGIELSSQLTEAIADKTLDSFGSVPLEAVRFQAEEGMRRLSRHSEDARSRISGIVELGLAQGWGSQRVARQMRQELGLLKSRAEMIARTESISSLDSATRANYQRNDIGYVQRVGTQDSRICGYCLDRIGNVYPVEKAPAALHPSDRCYNMPFKKEWAELGLIDLEWFEQHKADAIAQSEDQPRSGVAPFEKMSGATAPLKPAFTLDQLKNLPW